MSSGPQSPSADDDHVTQEASRGMQLLAEGVPLTLLIDLATPPHSHDLFEDEPGETDWLVGVAS